MGAGASVEVGDDFPGGGEHDRVEPSRPVGSPSAERIFSSSGEIADMHATMLRLESDSHPSRTAFTPTTGVTSAYGLWRIHDMKARVSCMGPSKDKRPLRSACRYVVRFR
jgi:hypothetical protein